MVNALIDKARACEGFVFGSPVYYAHPSGRLLSVLDRMFYAASDAFRGKVGAAVVSARRAGTTASLDAINKYFGISGMPVAGSTYWGMVHGGRAEDVLRDEEGLQTMRNPGAQYGLHDEERCPCARKRPDRARYGEGKPHQLYSIIVKQGEEYQ